MSDYFLAEKVYIILTFRFSILHSLPEDKIGAFNICSNIDYVYIHCVIKLIEETQKKECLLPIFIEIIIYITYVFCFSHCSIILRIKRHGK